jgi:cell division protein FtsN
MPSVATASAQLAGRANRWHSAGPQSRSLRPQEPTRPSPARCGGRAVLQIGAYETGDADGAWAAFKARHAGVAGTLAEDVEKVDLGTKGIWYRLRMGPFADKTPAAAACEKLKAEGATCFLAAP